MSVQIDDRNSRIARTWPGVQEQTLFPPEMLRQAKERNAEINRKQLQANASIINKPSELQKTKLCSRCGMELPVDEFSRNRTAKDGLQSECKQCFKERGAKLKKYSGTKIGDIYNYKSQRKIMICYDYINSNMTVKQIMGKYGIVSKTTVYKYLADAGITERRDKEMSSRMKRRDAITETPEKFAEPQDYNQTQTTEIMEVKEMETENKFELLSMMELTDKMAELIGEIKRRAEAEAYEIESVKSEAEQAKMESISFKKRIKEFVDNFKGEI